jgi:hypothetical protein
MCGQGWEGLDLLRDLARAGCSTGNGKYGRFLASVHREVSVALCKGNHAIFRAGMHSIPLPVGMLAFLGC